MLRARGVGCQLAEVLHVHVFCSSDPHAAVKVYVVSEADGSSRH